MTQATFTITIPHGIFTDAVKDALYQIENERQNKAVDKEKLFKTFTINQVAKKLGRSHSTIANLVKSNVIKATPDGRITEKALEEYLKEV